jgi:hypothetical protein
VPRPRVLNHALPGRIHAGRADQTIHVPMVMTRAAVAALISLLDGTAQLVAILLHGRGVRLVAAGWLRIKDIDVQSNPLTVRAGTGDQDRFTTFPVTQTPVLQNHLAGVTTRLQRDSAPGHGEV